MPKVKKLFIITIVISIIFLSHTAYSLDKKTGFVPNAYLQGDVQTVINLKEITDIESREITYKDNKLEVYKLKDVIGKAKPLSNQYNIIISAEDGLRAKISGDKIEESYLNFSHQHGWEVINLNHPISSNIKLIDSITIVDKSKDKNEAFTIITPDKNHFIKTPGQLLVETFQKKAVFEGKSTQNVEGVNYTTEIYSEKRVLKPELLIEKDFAKRTIIFNDKGKTLSYNGGYLELKNNYINYINPKQKEELSDIKGIVIDAPLKSNKNTYYDAIHYLENGEKVMVILLDGFGYHQYEYLKKNNQIPFLSKIENNAKVITSYKPVTNTGLAAVLTGKGPTENGVYNREFKDLKSPDIFKKASDLGLESAYIEGNIKILNTYVDPILNPDLNENDTTDDEVFNETKKQIKNGSQFIFAHFHGIDDSGHDYGPLGEETIQVIKQTDNYISQLAEIWDGKIIITSDHGMHATREGGDHGLVLYEDMFVPYLITEGGKTDE